MTTINTSDTSLTVRRTFDATREHVEDAFTDPDELEQLTPVAHIAGCPSRSWRFRSSHWENCGLACGGGHL